MSCKVFFGTLTKFGFGCKKRNGFPFSCGFNNLKNFSSNGIPFENRRFLSLSAEAAARIDSQKKLERSERLKEACSSLPKFTEVLKTHNLLPFIRTETTVIQVNVGLLCNQTCQHCHVEAGPTRKKENMTKTEIDRILALLTHSPNVKVLDTTGGAPELNPHWKALVLGAKKLGLDIIDRCNLTVLFEPGMENLDSFLAENKIQIVASLPCYSPANVEKQRGKGVFAKSIQALQKLNKLGYGLEGSGLLLDLVYNPIGAHLPPSQQKLEQQYKFELDKYCGIKFNKLYTITNMPIKRYADFLFTQGEYVHYMSLLVNNFNSQTVNNLMCRNLVSISWDGKLFDCDFNQMLEIPIGATRNQKNKQNLTIWDIESFSDMKDAHIATERHCFGCTAGSGSSCGGAVI